MKQATLRILCLTAACVAVSFGCSGGGGAGASGVSGSGGTSGGSQGEASSSDAAPEARGQAEVDARPPASPWVESVAYRADANQIVFATADGAVWSLDLSSGEAVTSGNLGEAAEQISLCQAGGLALAYGGEAPRLFGVGSQKELLRFASFSDAHAGALSSSGKFLALATPSTVGMWHFPNFAKGFSEGEDLESYLNRQEPTQNIEGLPGRASTLEINDSGQLVIALDDGDELGTLWSWNPTSPEDIAFVGRTNASVRHIEFAHDETSVAAITEKDEVFIATFGKKGFARWAIGTPGRAANWMADGGVLIHTPDGATHAHNIEDGSERWSITPAQPFESCWSRDDRLVCSDGAILTVLDPSTGELLASVAAWEQKYLTFTPEGAHVGTADAAAWLKMVDGGSPVEMGAEAWSSLAQPKRVTAALNP